MISEQTPLHNIESNERVKFGDVRAAEVEISLERCLVKERTF